MCLFLFFPQEKVAHLRSKEHFKLSRVALFPHCSFPQACPYKVGNIGVFLKPIYFRFFLSFSPTFTFWLFSLSPHSPMYKLGTARHLLSKQTGSLTFPFWYCFFLAPRFPVVLETGTHILHSVTYPQSHVCWSKSLLRCFLKIVGFFLNKFISSDHEVIEHSRCV